MGHATRIVLLVVVASGAFATAWSDEGNRATVVMRLLEMARDGDDPARTIAILEGVRLGLQGSPLSLPKEWPALLAAWHRHPDLNVRVSAVLIGVGMHDAASADLAITMIADPALPTAARRQLLEEAGHRRLDRLPNLMTELFDDPEVRETALAASASFEDADLTRAIIARIGQWPGAVRRRAYQSLGSRKTSTEALCHAVEQSLVDSADIPQYVVRQIRQVAEGSPPHLKPLVEAIWGVARQSPQGVQAQITRYRDLLVAEELARADLRQGRLLCEKICLNCHRLHGEGGTIGPDITGAQRYDLDYLLSNIIDPSAQIGPDFEYHVIETHAGQVIAGIVTMEKADSIGVQTVNESFVLPLAEIVSRTPTGQSMMPEGMFDSLSEAEVRNLIAYLMSDY